MPNKLHEEEERNIYQTANIRGKSNKYESRDQFEKEKMENDEFKEINPIFGCLIPCLKCCIYPCRAFFLTGKCLSKKRRMKKNKKKLESKNKSNNPSINCSNYNYTANIQNQKPLYNQFYSASSNIGNTSQISHNSNYNADLSNRTNLRHPNITGNCISPICSGSSASFCTIQAEYPSNRRSVLPSSSSYGPRRYVEKYTNELQDFSETNELTYSCLGNSREEAIFDERVECEYSLLRREQIESICKNNHQDIRNNGNDCKEIRFNKEVVLANDFETYRYQQDSRYNLNDFQKINANSNLIFSSCLPCNYSDIVNSKYNQGNCFVDN